ncbi:ATP-binding protein [Pseudonocardia eucalypti]|uniref:Signal transduction histidine-protein kinase/phosphatase MprB n=1 Tax=Pseudonocardia eucalypti TaxID=648755 RepID=A0ABP9QFL3_9PSEU|nr:signal transduction histidine kinase [Pseudonocardia eucalypti]
MNDMLPRPLDPIRSIKLKLSILLLGSGGVGICYLWLAFGWLPSYTTTAVAIALVLLTAQVLSHGMTSPLREMTAAARAMARGDYTRRVRATARDEVGQLATAFNQMAADLAAADRQRRELIANVSHELRTPVTALRAVLENAVDGVAPAEPALRTALDHTERLAQLVADFLDLSRLDAGALTLRREDFELAPLLDEAVAESRAAAGRAVRFEVVVEPAGLAVNADRARLRQVVLNLLDNAARHGPAEGRVLVLARTEEGRRVLEVRDDGPGIPADQRDRVFQRFTRGERAAGGGTGLGLAIARWLVDLHGGEITVTDPNPATAAGVGPEDRAGCVVRVTLPARSTP